MLTVDRHDLAAARRGGRSHQLAGRHEGLFIGERDTLPCPQCRERRIQAGRADHRIHDDVHARQRRGCHQTFGADLPLRGIRPAVLDESYIRRAEATGLVFEQQRIPVGGQRIDSKRRSLPFEHPECGRPDRAGRAKHRDAADAGAGKVPDSRSPRDSPAHRRALTERRSRNGAHRMVLIGDITRKPGMPNMMYATGSTNNKLSTRSSTPPCPGNSRELFFTPASRLSSDSARSPICAATLTATPKITMPDRLKPRSADGTRTRPTYSQHAATVTTTPPMAPATVLPGLIAGISLRRPSARPTAYAPMSLAHVSSSGSSRSAMPARSSATYR